MRDLAQSETGYSISELYVVVALIGIMVFLAVPFLMTYVPTAIVSYSARELHEPFRKAAVPLGLRNAPDSSGGAGSPSPLGGAGSPGPPASGSSTTSIKFDKGQAAVADAQINRTAAAKLVLDPNADQTVVSPHVLKAAGVPIPGGASDQVPGASPSGSPPTAWVDSIAVGRGVLGRDFLDRFEVSIDIKDGVATLSPKKR